MPSKNRCRHCVFTQNNWTADELRNLQSNLLDKASYYVFSEEVGIQKKTPHLQGYFQLTKQASISTIRKWWKKKIGRCCYVAPAFASSDDNIAYCTKIETSIGTVYEGGIKRNERGKRNDITAFRDSILAGDTDAAILQEHPQCFMRYQRGMEAAKAIHEEMTGTVILQRKLSGITLRPWQTKFIKLLLNQNDRQFLWVWDKVGNIGKTVMADWLQLYHQAAKYDNMPKRDFATAYNKAPIVIFDLERKDQNEFDYSIIKCLKGGAIAVQKYKSRMKPFMPAQVLVLANWPPDEYALSPDMYLIREVKKIN